MDRVNTALQQSFKKTVKTNDIGNEHDVMFLCKQQFFLQLIKNTQNVTKQFTLR